MKIFDSDVFKFDKKYKLIFLSIMIALISFRFITKYNSNPFWMVIISIILIYSALKRDLINRFEQLQLSTYVLIIVLLEIVALGTTYICSFLPGCTEANPKNQEAFIQGDWTTLILKPSIIIFITFMFLLSFELPYFRRIIKKLDDDWKAVVILIPWTFYFLLLVDRLFDAFSNVIELSGV
jgi:hypothetical protein